MSGDLFRMTSYSWQQTLKAIYEHAVARYADKDRDLAGYFSDEQKEQLASIGLRPINVYDYAEDVNNHGEPDWETFLLVAAARRDFFLHEQGGKLCTDEISESDLPPKSSSLDGVAWLPRILRKARCFLNGGLCHDIMYGCGGDRKFLKAHNIHAADFLRVVWASHGDDGKVLDYVRQQR